MTENTSSLLTRKQGSISLSWKHCVISGFVGYFLAVMTATGRYDARWLEESDEENKEENGEDETTMKIAIPSIILLLILLTITFELLKEYLEESVNGNIKPILASLFGELTVLGFLSIFTFVLTRSGFMPLLSRAIFGEGEEEKNILLETFEDVHYMLFFIMVSFIFLIILVVRESSRLENSWFKMNVICRNRHSTNTTNFDEEEDNESIGEEVRDELIRETNIDGKTLMPSFTSYLFRSIIPCFDSRENVYSDYMTHRFYKFTMEDLYLFSELRKEFILERDMSKPPFVPDPNPAVSDDFNFGRYLIICLGNTLGHAVHLHYYTWAFLALLTLIYSSISLLLRDTKVFEWIWVASAYICFLINTYLDYHMLQILYQMIPEIKLDPSTSLSSTSSSLLPAWTNIKLSETKEAKHTTRQDTLYWRGRKGPKCYSIFFQIKVLCISAYMSVLFAKIYPNVLPDVDLSILWKTSYVIVSLIPLILLFRNFPRLVSQLTIVSSIGVHRRPQIVSHVVRMEKTDHLLQSMLIMQKLQNLDATNEIRASESETRVSMIMKHQALGKDQKAAISRIFDNFDENGDGTIYTSELHNIFQSLGQAMSPESLDAIIRFIDRNNDGTITKDEFTIFYSEHIIGAEMDYNDIDNIAKQLFAQFDLDQSGEITFSEFVKVINSFNVGLTMDEISELLHGVSGENTSISEHEFRSLIESHHHLFDNGLTRRSL